MPESLQEITLRRVSVLRSEGKGTWEINAILKQEERERLRSAILYDLFEATSLGDVKRVLEDVIEKLL